MPTPPHKHNSSLHIEQNEAMSFWTVLRNGIVTASVLMFCVSRYYVVQNWNLIVNAMDRKGLYVLLISLYIIHSFKYIECKAIASVQFNLIFK